MKSPEKEEEDSKSPDLGPLTDFHQLLLLRMLRPDRLPVGLSKYINKYLTLNLPEQVEFSLSDVLKDSKRHLGVLLLLPENSSSMTSHPVSRLRLTTPPIDVLFSLAKVWVFLHKFFSASVILGQYNYLRILIKHKKTNIK